MTAMIWRIFRIERIRHLRLTGARTPPRQLPAADVGAYVAAKLYSLAPTYQAIATLHAPAAKVASRLGGTLGTLAPLDEQTCRLHSHADTLEWLAFRLMMLGCEFELHQPPELAEYLRALSARLIRAAGSSTAPSTGNAVESG